MIIGKLIGEADGHTEAHEFPNVEAVKAWARGAGLAAFDDQTARGEAWQGSDLLWSQSGLQTAEQRQREFNRDAARVRAFRGIEDKKRYL